MTSWIRHRNPFPPVFRLTFGLALVALGLSGVGCSDSGGGDTPASPNPPADFAGTWDARFAGGSSGMNIDSLERGVLLLTQNGGAVTGTLDFEGIPTAAAGGTVDGQVLSFTAITNLDDGRQLRVVATGTLISENVWSGTFSMTLEERASRGLFEATRR